VAIAALLAQSAHAAEDLRCFFQAQVLFWMLRAIDGHAKDFSLFLLPGGSYRLTPLYDVLSAWPVIGKAAGQWPEQELHLAMAWHGTKIPTSKPFQLQRRHLISTASRMGLGIEADALVANLAARTSEVIATVQRHLTAASVPQRLSDVDARLARFSLTVIPERHPSWERLWERPALRSVTPAPTPRCSTTCPPVRKPWGRPQPARWICWRGLSSRSGPIDLAGPSGGLGEGRSG